MKFVERVFGGKRGGGVVLRVEGGQGELDLWESQEVTGRADQEIQPNPNRPSWFLFAKH